MYIHDTFTATVTILINCIIYCFFIQIIPLYFVQFLVFSEFISVFLTGRLNIVNNEILHKQFFQNAFQEF